MTETHRCISHHISKNETFNLPLTQSELGDLTGTSRESVCRILTEFLQDGIINQAGKEISIINAEKLEKISKNG